MYRPPKRRRTDRRNELWTVGDHQDFEEGMTAELHGIRQELVNLRKDMTALQLRFAAILGGVAVLVVVFSIIGPYVIPHLLH